MPTHLPRLSFLKKKRTREGNSDSNPTSPVTPTSKQFDPPQRQSPPSTSGPQPATTSVSAPEPRLGSGTGSTGAGTGPAAPTNVPTSQQQHSNYHDSNQLQQQQQQQQQQQLNQHPSSSSSHPPPPPQGSTAADAVQQRQQMNPVHQPPPSANTTTSSSSPHPHHPHATSPGHDPQNLPSISSLINHPQQQPQHQHDGAGNSYSSSPYPATLNTHVTPPPSASPGTDPSRLQQQQHQAHPPPPPQHQQQPLTPSMQHHVPHQPDQQQLQQQQQLHHQHTNSSHMHQQSVPQPSQPRVTKGKYSLTDFEIQRTLGTGSFGRVHLVQSKHNQRFYAVKVLKKAQVVKMKQVEHTNDERRMLSDVKHPFLITLWGTFQDWKNLYMVMDFVEGGELFSLLRKSGRFPNPVAKFYAAEVTLALEYLHSKNIIYRDLKPENLLLDRHGHLKITDFGFAKRVPDKTWTLCGTPDYLAPEVVSNKGYNKSVDWWSLGILIYEMLCGYTPFWDSGSPMKIYENILRGKVKYPAYINPDAQDLLQRLITADLTKRLGNLFGGSQDVKNHPWFSEVTWDRLARKDIDAPYTPPVKAGAGDASQFDRYPEDPEKYGVAGGPDEFGHLFTEF